MIFPDYRNLYHKRIFFLKKYRLKRKFCPCLRVYKDMRIKNDTRQPERGVSDTWEIRLDRDLIHRIRHLAKRRKSTMSWLARYVVFRLVHKKYIAEGNFHAMVDEIRANRQPFRELGRFYICLYGDDVLWIKMQAARMGVTVSMLVRVALLRYLSTLEDEQRVPWWRLFWYGIKLNKSVVVSRLRKHRCHVQEFLNNQSYTADEYWNIPPGPLPTFLLQPATP